MVVDPSAPICSWGTAVEPPPSTGTPGMAADPPAPTGPEDGPMVWPVSANDFKSQYTEAKYIGFDREEALRSILGSHITTERKYVKKTLVSSFCTF